MRKKQYIMIYRFLFPRYSGTSYKASWLLLCARVIFGTLLMTHGFAKLYNYQELANSFPDPIGIGSQFSLILAIGAEFFCSMAFIFGFLYRLVLIPMIFTMAMAVYIIHSADPFAVKELAFVYLLIFIMLYITGPGQYAVDYFIANRPQPVPAS